MSRLVVAVPAAVLGQRVRPGCHRPRAMTIHLAVLLCSDSACAERVEAVGTVPELETLACDCGSGLLVLGWPEPR